MPLRRVLSTSWAPVIVTALFTIALLLRYDVGVLDVVVYAVYFALGVSLPGVLAWRMLLAHLHTESRTSTRPILAREPAPKTRSASTRTKTGPARPGSRT